MMYETCDVCLYWPHQLVSRSCFILLIVLKLKAATAQPNLVNGQRGGGDADSGPATMNGMNSDHQDNRLNSNLNTTEAQNGHEKPDQVVQPDTKCPLLNGHSEASADDPDSKSEVVADQSDATESNSEDLPSENGTEEGDKSKEVEGENGERTDSEKESQKDSKVEDVIVIQDTAFTLKIVPPVSEAFELQVCFTTCFYIDLFLSYPYITNSLNRAQIRGQNPQGCMSCSLKLTRTREFVGRPESK